MSSWGCLLHEPQPFGSICLHTIYVAQSPTLFCRRVANRESAQRVRHKRQVQLEELQAKVANRCHSRCHNPVDPFFADPNCGCDTFIRLSLLHACKSE